MDADGPKTILKRDALGRVTLPREQREALIAEFERSGLRGTQFARMVGINYGTFASWMQDRRHSRGDYARSDRGEARVSPAVPLRVMEAVITVLNAVWFVAGRPCGKRLLPAFELTRVPA